MRKRKGTSGVNAWAVLSVAADVEKGKRAMDSVDKYLFTPYDSQQLINAPRAK